MSVEDFLEEWKSDSPYVEVKYWGAEEDAGRDTQDDKFCKDNM